MSSGTNNAIFVISNGPNDSNFREPIFFLTGDRKPTIQIAGNENRSVRPIEL